MSATGSVALENVTFEYPGIRALDGISLEFLPGEVHAVAGENGAGKSTLLKVLAGLVTPVSGRIRIGSQVFTALRRARHLGVRSIPQEPVLAPDLSIAENVHMGRLPLHKVVDFVSHRLEEIFAICGSVSILRDGRLVGTRLVAETAQEELIRMMVGRELAVARASVHARTADPRLHVRLRGASFEL